MRKAIRPTAIGQDTTRNNETPIRKSESNESLLALPSRRMVCDAMDMRHQPIKTYKTTATVTIVALLHIAVVALFVYGLFSSDVLWWHWLIVGFLMVMISWFAVTWLQHIKDRIVVFEDSLLLTRAERKKSKQGKWKDVRNVELPWNTIKGFSSTTENVSWRYLSLSRRRWIEIPVREGETYRVSPDLYDTFRLKKKL